MLKRLLVLAAAAVAPTVGWAASSNVNSLTASGAIVGTQQVYCPTTAAGSDLKCTFTQVDAFINAQFSGDMTSNGTGTTTVASIGGKAVSLGAALNTTGAGVPTLAFGSGTATYTYSGTSGTLAELGLAQSWSAAQTYAASDIVLTGATGCITATAGVLSGTGSSCGAGSLTFPATVAGTTTSGGVPYFSGATTLTSSAALAANAIVLGGGAGAAPATTTTGTGVVTAIGNAVNTTGGLVTQSGALAANSLLIGGGSATAITSTTTGTGVVTALGVNTGSTGSFVVQNGALGTPSSGTLTNATGLPIAGIASTGTGIATGLAAGVNSTSSGSLATTAAPLTAGGSGSISGGDGYYICTGTCTVTLPTPAAGFQFCIRNDSTVTSVITIGAISSVQFEKTTYNGYGTVTTGTMVSGGALGDKICLVGRDATHYLVGTFVGSWTNS